MCCPHAAVAFAHPGDKRGYGAVTVGKKHGGQVSNLDNV